MSKLDQATLPKRSDRPWVSRSAAGLLELGTPERHSCPHAGAVFELCLRESEA
jgi:hypothetical protein